VAGPVLTYISIHRTRRVDIGWASIHTLIVVVSEPKLKIFLSDAREIVVDNAVYRLSISLLFPEIFPATVKSRPKSRRIMDVFGFPNSQIVGVLALLPPQKMYPGCHARLAARHVAKFRGITPSTTKVMNPLSPL